MPGHEVRRLFDYVRDDVMDATNKRHQPAAGTKGLLFRFREVEPFEVALVGVLRDHSRTTHLIPTGRSLHTKCAFYDKWARPGPKRPAKTMAVVTGPGCRKSDSTPA